MTKAPSLTRPSKKTQTQQDKEVLYNRAIDVVLPFMGSELPDLSKTNVTPEALVDYIGVVNDAQKDFEKVEKLLKEILKSKLEGRTELRGDAYEMKRAVHEVTRLNQAKAKDILEGIGKLSQCMDTSEQERTTFKKI